MGGLVALQIAENPTQAATFDGALAMCTPGMGLSRWTDGLIDFDIFWRVAKGERYPGTNAVNDVPWPFDWTSGVQPYVTLRLETPSAFSLMEIQRLLSGLANPSSFYYVLPNSGVYATAMLATQLLGDLQNQVGAPFGPLDAQGFATFWKPTHLKADFWFQMIKACFSAVENAQLGCPATAK